MKHRVLGSRYVDMVDRDTGRPIKGTSLFCAFKDPDVQGEATSKIFISDNLGFPAAALKPGDLIDLEFNQKGRVVGLQVLNGPK